MFTRQPSVLDSDHEQPSAGGIPRAPNIWEVPMYTMTITVQGGATLVSKGHRSMRAALKDAIAEDADREHTKAVPVVSVHITLS